MSPHPRERFIRGCGCGGACPGRAGLKEPCRQAMILHIWSLAKYLVHHFLVYAEGRLWNSEPGKTCYLSLFRFDSSSIRRFGRIS